jgi:hypothetical protein
MNDDFDPPRVHYKFRPTEHPRVTDKDKMEHPAAIDVKQILHENFIAGGGKTAPKLRPVEWKSRRWRDYLFLIAAPNAIIGLLIYLAPRHELIPLAGFSLMVLYSLGVTWLVWVIMDE